MSEILRGKTIVGSVIKSLNKAKKYGKLDLQSIYLLKVIGKFLDKGVECLPFEKRQRLETLYNYIKYNDEDVCNLREKDLNSFKYIPFCKDCNNNRLVSNKGLPTVDNSGKIIDKDYIFQTSDFTTNFKDPFNGTFKLVRINTLPTEGVLLFNNQPIVEGFEFNISQVNNLVFSLENIDLNLTLPFTFQTSNNNINTLFSNMATYTININAYVNQPPSEVGDNSVTIDNAATYVFTVADFTTNTTPPYSDPEGDSAANLRVLSLPVDGELQFNGTSVNLNDIIPFEGSPSINGGQFRYIASASNPSSDVENFNFEVSDTGSQQFTS